MSAYHIAVLDVGKTNKKVLVYDDTLSVVDSAYETFEERVEGHVHFEPVEEMTAWFKKQLSVFSSKYAVKAVSVTTHGATAVALGADGSLAVPPVAYTTDAGEEFRGEFYETFGNREQLQESTATAEIGSLINVAKKVFFWKKYYPDQFAKAERILYFPQYFGFVLTGKLGAEPTYTGCHTYLWDFRRGGYSEVARKLGVADMLPSTISKPWDILGTVSPEIARETGLSTDCVVTMGIHDSNSSLLPYLVKGYGNFALNSTGTWCVAMHPTDTVSFEKEDLGKLVFYFLDAFNNPVKTSIFMGGQEFDTYTEIIRTHSSGEDFPGYDPELYAKIVAERKLFILPSVVKGTGIFPDAVPRIIEDGREFTLEDIKAGHILPDFMKDYRTAHAVIRISLAIQTSVALRMAGFGGRGSIFTEGGFRRNEGYNKLLASLFPHSTVSLTRLEEATAFGAAILGKAALDGTGPAETRDCFEIERIEVPGDRIDGLERYTRDFLDRL